MTALRSPLQPALRSALQLLSLQPNPFAQDGPTLDLVFAGVATDPLGVATTQDQTLNINFAEQTYQWAQSYVIWE